MMRKKGRRPRCMLCALSEGSVWLYQY